MNLGIDDPRPGGVPAYIPNRCNDCGGRLVLVDAEVDEETGEKIVMHDEWTCPVCRDGVYMDWPAEELESFRETLRATLEEPVTRQLELRC
jgi:uncharacterized protein with PIN domain